MRKFVVCIVISFISLTVSAQDKITYTEHIAPIIYNNCTECHRPNTAAPFNLMSYKDVSKRAKTIKRVTQEKYMPPWHPVPGHGDFVGDRRQR